MDPGHTTCILHHPARPVDCLVRVLDSLRLATDEPHKVEVVIQGPSLEPLPPVEAYDDFELTYVQLKLNEGLSKPAAESMARATTRWWAKLDDDMILPPHAWDTLTGAMVGWPARRASRLPSTEAEAGVARRHPGFRHRGGAGGPTSPTAPRKPAQRVGACMMATPNVASRVIKIVDDQLTEVEEECPLGLTMRTRRGTFEATETLGSGATVFDRRMLNDGVAFDPRYMVGGADLDLCLQMIKAEWNMLLCTWPRVSHIYEECTSAEYEAVRWSPEDLEASRQLFEAKWGKRPPF